MSESRFSLRRIAINTLAVSGGEVANKACTFLVYAAVSRLAGLEAFGQLSIGLTLLYTCHVFGYAGLPTTLIRLVAKRPNSARRYLVHGYLAATATSLIAALVMLFVALAMRYQTSTTQVLCILALGVPFYSLTMIAEAIIKGQEKMHLIAMGNVPGNLLMVLGSLLVLWLGWGALGVAAVVVVSRLATLISLTLAAFQVSTPRRNSRVFPWLSVRLIKRSHVFLGSDGIAAIGASLFALILSKFASEREVAMLSAAFQLMQPVQILYRSVGHSAFPSLVAAAKAGSVAVAQLSHSVLGIVVQLAFPACLVMFALASDLLNLVYGHKGFGEGSFVLQTLAFTLLCDPLNPILGHGLWAVGEDKSVLRIVVTNVCVNLLLGLILIGGWGLAGAAACALIASLVNTAQHYWMFARKVGPPRLSGTLMRLSPALLVAISLVLLAPWNRYVALISALAAYALLTLILTHSTTDLPNLLRKRTTPEHL